MKNTSLVAILMLGLGIAIGWFAKPNPSSVNATAGTAPNKTGETATKPAPAAPQATAEVVPPGKRALREPTVKKPSNMPSEEDMDRAKKMQSEMTTAMVGRQRSKFEQHIERLAETLSLSADQKAKMTAWLDGRMKKFEEIDFTNPESMASLTDLTKSLSTQAIEDELATSLTEDQKTAFAAYKEKDHQTKVDTAALKSLSQLQGIIQFEDGQRDEVYKVLTAAAEEKLQREQSSPDPTSLFTEGMGIEMDPYDLGIQQAMTESMIGDAKSGVAGDQKQLAQNIRETIQKRIDAKVEQLRPVLNAKQLEQYRAELKAKGPGIMGTALMGMEGEGPSSSSIVIPAN